ncbi:heme o synthase [Buchnera aphidicola]|uniref:heme o synthase n=1 Tax=Buchnera aphidicola TaxID=9 RepID=UPI00346417F3
MIQLYFLRYLELIKPKIIFGNLISLIGAFFLASKGDVNFSLLLSSMIGTSLIIASACIMNNIIDRDIDKRMQRTKNRILVKNIFSIKMVFYVSLLLFIIGMCIFYFFVNILSMLLILMAFFIYVVVYSIYMKRNSIYSTFIGSVSGSIPPVVGYCSVVNNFDICAFILFLMFIFWQIPHSYAIAICYFNDYKKENIPVLPISRGILVAKYYIILYILCFIVLSLMLTIMGYTGYKYFLCLLLLGLAWLYLGIKGLYITNDFIWARELFYFSIILIFITSIMISIDFIP